MVLYQKFRQVYERYLGHLQSSRNLCNVNNVHVVQLSSSPQQRILEDNKIRFRHVYTYSGPTCIMVLHTSLLISGREWLVPVIISKRV